MKTVALVPDLVFRSKILETARLLGREIDFVQDPQLIGGAGLVIIDLDAFGVERVATIRARNPGVKMVGFCSHVNVALMRRSREAGVQVVPRSIMVKSLSSLLA